MKTGSGLLLSLLLLSPFAVQAKIFMCKDASGRTLTSDRPIPECADRTVKELDKSGIVRREIAPPPTAEEKRQMQAEAEKRKAEEALAMEQKRTDDAIRARFRNEQEIEVARKRTVDIVQEQLKRETTTLATAEQRKKEADAEAAKIKNPKDMPPMLARKLEETGQAVAFSKKKIKEYEGEIAQIDAKFDQTLKRFRELNGQAPSASATAAASTPAAPAGKIVPAAAR